MKSRIVVLAVLAALILQSVARAQSETESPEEKRETVRYLEVPMTGAFGEELTAPGVRNAMQLAKARKATHVFFVMDTPGGRVADADAIAKLLDDHREDFYYVVVVKRCISAGVWVMSRADEIFFYPDGTAGGAVAFTQSSKTGSAQVDAKFNSIKAAGLASAAAARGQSGVLYRAMVLMEACVYVVREEDGRIRVTDQRPESGQFTEIDSAQSVLTVTPDVAREMEFGWVLAKGDLGSIAALRGWDLQAVAPPAETQMRDGARLVRERASQVERATKALSSAADRANELMRLVPRQVEKARAEDPGKLKLYVTGSGTLTPDSQQRWRNQTDRALAEWNNVIHLVNEINSELNKYDRAVRDVNAAIAKEYEARLYPEKPEPFDPERPNMKLQLNELTRAANDARSQLAQNRSKSRI